MSGNINLCTDWQLTVIVRDSCVFNNNLTLVAWLYMSADIIHVESTRLTALRPIKLYSPKKETQHVEKYNLLQIFKIILNTEISITLH